MKDFETDQEDFKLDRKQKIRQDQERDFAERRDKFASKRRRDAQPYKRQKIDPNDFLDDDYYEHME